MFARALALFAPFALAGCAATAGDAPSAASRAQGAALAQACAGRDGWSDAAPPAHIFGNVYYVGTCGITVLLITSPRGHVLIDGATAEAVPSILANIRAVGADPRDVRWIIGSHEHIDHMGGFAALKAATGADIIVSAAAAAVLTSGQTDAADPQSGIIDTMAPVAVSTQPVEDGQPWQFNDYLRLTPVLTPGHTSGGTSWTWISCERRTCRSFAYVDSMTAVSRDDYRFSDHPERVAPFRATFARVAQLPCDILITPHPGFSDLFTRLSGAQPLVDPAACQSLADAMRARLDSRLARERGA